jgi:putative oxidoreductase
MIRATLALAIKLTRAAMLRPAQTFSDACLLAGRLLLGLYFILPGVMKILDLQGTADYMAAHDVPLISVLLVLTIALQLGCGAMLIVGFRGRTAGFLLAGLTLVISVYMHNFWDMEEGIQRNHELQNFTKNMGIMAGLLIVAALGTGRFSLSGQQRSGDVRTD